MLTLHWVDYVIIAIIGLSVLTGLFRGFIKELISLSVWVLAIWIAVKYAACLDPWTMKFIQDKTARAAAGFIIVLILVLIAGGLVNALLSFILKRSGLSGTDRLLGMGFGFVRGIFVVSLLILIAKMLSLPTDQYRQESRLYTKFDPAVNWLYEKMPEFIKQAKAFDKADPNQPQNFQAEP